MTELCKLTVPTENKKKGRQSLLIKKTWMRIIEQCQYNVGCGKHIYLNNSYLIINLKKNSTVEKHFSQIKLID